MRGECVTYKQSIVLSNQLVGASGLLYPKWRVMLPLQGICVFIEGPFCRSLINLSVYF